MEMMVAMTIGMILLGGVITVLTSSKVTYRVNEAMARMQENARFAFQLLSRDLRMAGYWGCGGVVPQGMDQPLEGLDAVTDTFVIRGVDGNGVVIDSHSSADMNFNVPAGAGFKAGQTVLVSNCQSAAILQVTGVIKDVITPKDKDVITPEVKDVISYALVKNNPKGDFDFKNGEAIRINTREYYVGAGKSGVPALFQKIVQTSPQSFELVEGIEDMQIQYGEDTNEDLAADIYRTTADEVANWEAVVSVRIDLLVQSVEDGIASQPQTYTFNGATQTPTDRRLRQTFSTVISLRNRAS